MSQAATVSGQPTVLVVDDEEDLRDVMRRILERRGFSVIEAGDPAQAVSVCRDHDDEIDLLLTDLTMPGADEVDLAEVATGLRPRLRVLYVSGLPRDVAVSKGLVAEDAGLVQKPFTPDSLVAAVRGALADQPPA